MAAQPIENLICSTETNAARRVSIDFESLQQADMRVYEIEDTTLDPESIGLDPELHGMRAEAILEFALPRSAEQDWHAVVLKVTDKKGNHHYGIQSLEVDTDGNRQLGTVKPIGFGTNEDGTVNTVVLTNRLHESHKGITVVHPKDIWGEEWEDNGYGINAELTPDENEITVQNSAQDIIRINKLPKEKYSEHTAVILGALSSQGLLEGDRYNGRQFITREYEFTGKDNVVEIRSRIGREAVVIDWSRPEHKAVKDQYVAEVEKRLLRASGKVEKDELFKAVKDVVVEKMSYDLDYVKNRAAEAERKDTKYRKVNLAVIMRDSKGVCEHQGLTSAVIVADLKEKYALTGTITVCTEYRVGMGSHQYMVYTEGDERWIIDPAMDYAGPDDKCPDWDHRSKKAKMATGNWES